VLPLGKVVLPIYSFLFYPFIQLFILVGGGLRFYLLQLSKHNVKLLKSNPTWLWDADLDLIETAGYQNNYKEAIKLTNQLSLNVDYALIFFIRRRHQLSFQFFSTAQFSK